MTEDAQLLRSFEERGEDQVGLDVAAGNYGSHGSRKEMLAREWLRRKDEARNAASHSEQMDLARRATEAAEAAAISARLANTHAKTANRIAVAAAIAAIAAIVLSIVGLSTGRGP